MPARSPDLSSAAAPQKGDPFMPLHADLLANWDVPFARLRPDLAIAGSPERCIVRRVVEDGSGCLWLLERLAPDKAARREAIALLVDGLAASGLWGLAPYRQAKDGGFVVMDWGGVWQLSAFVPGRALERPGYLDNADLGDALGSWLAALRTSGRKTAVPPGLRELDLPAFVRDLLAALALRDPDVHGQAQRLMPALSGFFEAWGELPRKLAHGDVHPLNVVWGESGVAAVIDWEFAGMMPSVYDLANCLGCLGIEGAGGFTGPFCRALLRRAATEGLLPDSHAAWLPEAILASRFGWLSEWLRRDDGEMIRTELAYMNWLAGEAASGKTGRLGLLGI
jgi:homoserine kinase type II